MWKSWAAKKCGGVRIDYAQAEQLGEDYRVPGEVATRRPDYQHVLKGSIRSLTDQGAS